MLIIIPVAHDLSIIRYARVNFVLAEKCYRIHQNILYYQLLLKR